MNNDSYFVRNQKNILIGAVLVLVVAGLLVWAYIKNHKYSEGPQQTLTAEQIRAIASDTPTGPETLTKNERATILKDDATSTESLTAQQRASILGDNPK